MVVVTVGTPVLLMALVKPPSRPWVEVAPAITIASVEIPISVKPAAEMVIEARRKSKPRAVYRSVPVSRYPNRASIVL